MVHCKNKVMLSQPFSPCSIECAIHNKQDVCEEQHPYVSGVKEQ